MKISLELNIGMASFVLGNTIDSYLKLYSFNYIEAEVNENWDEYNFFDDSLEVYVDKKSRLIESIASRVNCTYKNINMIGYSFNDFLNLVNIKKDDLEKDEIWLEGDELQSVYELPDMALQIWVDSHNNIRTVFVG